MKKSDAGLTVKKEENFSEWFIQMILKSELADYSSVSGCIVLRPRAYSIWEKIVAECNKEFKKTGVKNCYFPLFIPEKAFEKEKEHIEGFAPEVAWVTIAGNTKLSERLAVRPTSEAIMYESYAKWIRSWKDLPLLLNQWNNAVRWEFKHPVPFFRTREFLWNEMHTAFENEREALKHGKLIMKSYNKITQDLMALPGIYGRKTETEKFAGAVFSEKMHHFLTNGKVIEGTCFHHDGQNFAKAYGIKFLDKKEKENYVFQNTHAISTRMLGTMFAIHSDNKGLIIPPKIAENKVVIIPLLFKGKEKEILNESKRIKKILKEFSPILDDRKDYSPGWKFNEWELKGIPLRIEIGPKDLEKNHITIAKRDDGKKLQIKTSSLKREVYNLLEKIQVELYKKAKENMESLIEKTESRKKMIQIIKDKKTALVPLCSSKKCEESIKEQTKGAKVLFISSQNTPRKKCVMCNKAASYLVYVGRVY